MDVVPPVIGAIGVEKGSHDHGQAGLFPPGALTHVAAAAAYEAKCEVHVLVPCSSCSKVNRVPASRMDEKAKCAACKTALLPLMRPVALGSAQDFDELIRDAAAPVLVDFWAAWCGPCRMVAPELEKIASERGGRLIVAKVDTEALPEVAARFDIQSIPTMILFRGGKEAARLNGAMPASAIASQLAL